MTERERARRVLGECRDVLVARLIERVLESDSALIDDARGDSYAAEIESLQEQVGARLQAVNQLLGLIPLDEPMVYTAQADAAPGSTEIVDVPQFSPDEPPKPSFQTFTRLVLADQIGEAGQVLESILGLSPARSRECALRFADQLRSQPGFLTRAMALRVELSSGTFNGAMELLSECFGLDGLESAVAWHRLSEQR